MMMCVESDTVLDLKKIFRKRRVQRERERERERDFENCIEIINIYNISDSVSELVVRTVWWDIEVKRDYVILRYFQ